MFEQYKKQIIIGLVVLGAIIAFMIFGGSNKTGTTNFGDANSGTQEIDQSTNVDVDNGTNAEAKNENVIDFSVSQDQ